MPLDESARVIAAGITAILLFFSWFCLHHNFGGFIRKRLYSFPPSPPSNAIRGHRLPTKNSFLTIESWIEQHGPLISLREGLHRYVVIGRYKAATDIMEKQGAALADRPRFIAAGELLARGLRLLLTPAGERLKRMRRALHVHLQPRTAQTYESLQMSYAKVVILSLLESPGEFHRHAHSYSATVILKLTYGKNTLTNASDPDVVQIRKSLERLAKSVRPGAYLVDSFPWLKYLPWYGRELRQGFIEDRAFYRRQLDAVKRQMNDPNSGPSFAKSLLAREIDFDLDETEMAFLAGSMFSAGVDTTALALCNVMTAAARYPDAQIAVHAELDAVVGNDRLPTFNDEESLPLLRAFILESARWRPLVPLGIPHRTTEDIIWGNYSIPSGTTVFGNHWAISHDPEVFPDPDVFDFRRWLTCEGNLINHLKSTQFGFGRRSLFINTALILWSFRVSIDESKPTDDMAFMQGAVRDTGLLFEPRMAKEKLKMVVEQ